MSELTEPGLTLLGHPSLRLQLSGLVLAAALPLVALVAFRTVQQWHTDSEQAVQQAERLARTVVHRTEVKLQRARALLERLAQRDDVKQLEPMRCGPEFGLFSDLQAEYTNLITVRNDGTRICSAVRPGPQAPTRVDPALYLAATLTSGRFTLGTVTRGIYTGRQILFAAQPLAPDTTGTSTGVVAVSIDLAALQLVDAEDDLPVGQVVQLVGAAGVVLASNVDPGAQIGSRAAASAPWWPKAQAGSGQLRDAQGVDRFYAAAPVQGTDWQAVVDLPADVVLAPARQRALLGVLAVLATLALALAIALRILRRTARPIEALAGLARHATAEPLMPAGQLPQPDLAAASRDEARHKGAMSNAMFLGIADSLVFTDAQRRIQAVNPAFTALFGYEPAEVIGQTPNLFYADPELFEGEARGRFDRAMTGERAYYEVLYRRKDGSTFWAESSGQRIVSPNGELLGMLGMHRDITERRRAAQSLAESHERFLRVFENAPVAMALSDAQDNTFVEVNPAFEALIGRTRIQTLGHTSTELGFWVDRQLRSALIGQLAAQSLVRHHEAQFRRADGSLVDVDYSGCVIELAGRRHIVSMVSDVTLQLQARRALQQHREELESLVAQRTTELEAARASLAERAAVLADLYNGAPCGYHSLTPEGIVAEVNDTELAMLGYRRDEFVGQPVERFMPPASQVVFRRNFADFQRKGSIRGVELDLIRQDGSLLPVLVDAVLITDGSERHNHSRSTVVDNSERKAREREREAMQAELAHRAGQAEAATLSKSAFLANMSHEIRTPMNAIIGLNHLLARDARDTLQRTRLAKADGAARHLLQLINDILDLAKVEAGKLVLEQVDFALDNVLTKAFEMVSERAREKGLELVLDTAHLPARLRGDPTRLSQALINLLSNAVKFTDRGWVRLRGELLASRAGRLQVRFDVTDTGAGIAPEHLPHLFNAFEQGDSSTTRRHGGTGLGLALTRQLATLMGGEVSVRSRLGEGSTFTFTAWLAPAAAAGEDAAPVSLQGLSALLVDDLPEAVKVLRERMESLGLQVDALTDPRAAAAQLSARMKSGRPYDLFVLDWRMGPPDGLQLLQQLREQLGPAAPPCLLVSAYDEEILWRESSRLQVEAVLVKPISPSTLYDALVRVMRGAGADVAGLDAHPGSAEAMLRSRHLGQRILLAEDNPVNQEVAAELLASVGLVVEMAENGASAVELAMSRPYDLVLMDMQMPVLDGLAATRALRAGLGGALPIVAMTANAFGEDRAACLAAGMNDHIAKPVNPETLYVTLLRWLPIPAAAAHSAPNATAASSHRADLDPLKDRLAAIDGFDVGQAWTVARGDEAVLRRLLQRFVQTYRDGVPEFVTGQPSTAWRAAAHSVRGACASLGARRPALAAQELDREIAASADDTTLAHLARALHEDLQALVRRLEAELAT